MHSLYIMTTYINRRLKLLFHISLFMFWFDFISDKCYFKERQANIAISPVIKIMLFFSINLQLPVKYIISCMNILYEIIFLYISLYYLLCTDTHNCDIWFVHYRWVFNIINIYLIHSMAVYLHRADIAIIAYEEDIERVAEYTEASLSSNNNRSNIISIISTIIPDNTWQCCICLSYEGIAIKLPCDHIVHQECMRAWANSSQSSSPNCPLCRRDLSRPIIQVIPATPPDSVLSNETA